MLKTHTSKELVMRALEMLAESIYPAPPDRIRSSTANSVPLNLLAFEQRAVMKLSQSEARASALLLANVVCRLAIEQKTSTLLITGQPSLTVLAVNLLLCRAKIDLDKVASSKWYQSEMDRLHVASGDLARAPLLVVGRMPAPKYMAEVNPVMSTNGSRCVVLDSPPRQTIWQWQQLSREFGVPITIISSNSVL